MHIHLSGEQTAHVRIDMGTGTSGTYWAVAGGLWWRVFDGCVSSSVNARESVSLLASAWRTEINLG